MLCKQATDHYAAEDFPPYKKRPKERAEFSEEWYKFLKKAFIGKPVVPECTGKDPKQHKILLISHLSGYLEFEG